MGDIPDLSISKRAIVTTMARRGLFNPGLPQRNVAQLAAQRTWGFGLDGQLRAAAARSPKRIAVVDETEGEVSYAGLLSRSEAVAAALARQGLRPGDAVGLLARNHVTAVAVIAGAAIAGLDLVLLNTGMGTGAVAEVARRERLRLIIHDDDLQASVADLPPDAGALGESALRTQAAAHPPAGAPRPPPRRGRTIMLTSGTTGRPRGAARPDPRGPTALVSIIERIPIRVGSRTLLSAPMFHTWGYSALLICLGLRHTLVLQRRFEADRALAALARDRCDTMIGVPIMLQRLMDLPEAATAERPRRLRVVATSGSAFPPGFTTAFMDRFGDVLYSLYGSTEASWICIATPGELRRHPDTVGRPPLGTAVRILDEHGAPVPDGTTGRVFCANPMVFRGYTSGEGREHVDGMVFTGDTGHVSDGLYFLDGRADDMVVSGGENVYPAQVERVLSAHPAVREVAVTGVPDAEFGQRLAAFVVLRDGGRLDEHQVRDYVRDRLARHCVPREVVFLSQLPRGSMGKVPLAELTALVGPE